MGYYSYLKKQLSKPWRLSLVHDHRPRVTVIVPVFNEAVLIEKRLENLRMTSYALHKLDIVVVDSGSTDGTAELAEKWVARNPAIRVKVVRECIRHGKAHALNVAFRHVTGDVIVMTDADSSWARGSLEGVVEYFSDPVVGAVTGTKEPEVSGLRARSTLETTYRSFYNSVRVAESKIHSTPIFNGELAAYRTELVKAVGLFPEKVGADDSHMAMLLALRGYRAIAVPDAVVYELTPYTRRGYLRWKSRRALHLVQHFVKLLARLDAFPGDLRRIIIVEVFLHILNPWLLIASFLMLLVFLVTNPLSPLGLALALCGVLPFIPRQTRALLRTWIVEQLVLLYASLSALFSTQLTWTKIEEIRATNRAESP